METAKHIPTKKQNQNTKTKTQKTRQPPFFTVGSQYRASYLIRNK